MLVKFQTFSFQAFTFPAILPRILIPNSQTCRDFPRSVFQKTLKFQKEDNSSCWSLNADIEAAIHNILQNRCS